MADLTVRALAARMVCGTCWADDVVSLVPDDRHVGWWLSQHIDPRIAAVQLDAGGVATWWQATAARSLYRPRDDRRADEHNQQDDQDGDPT